MNRQLVVQDVDYYYVYFFTGETLTKAKKYRNGTLWERPANSRVWWFTSRGGILPASSAMQYGRASVATDLIKLTPWYAGGRVEADRQLEPVLKLAE